MKSEVHSRSTTHPSSHRRPRAPGDIWGGYKAANRDSIGLQAGEINFWKKFYAGRRYSPVGDRESLPREGARNVLHTEEGEKQQLQEQGSDDRGTGPDSTCFTGRLTSHLTCGRWLCSVADVLCSSFLIFMRIFPGRNNCTAFTN